MDAHSRRVLAIHGTRIACRPGCAGCCRADLTVSPIEFALIERWLEAHPDALSPSEPTAARRVLTVLDEPGRRDCALLTPSGRCRIYEVRPLVCRTHGLPLLFEEDGELRGDVCPLNFDDDDGLASVPSTDFLNQDTLCTILAAINHAWAETTGTDPGRRLNLESLALVR